mgnify:CR=1 FL=1
MDDTSLCFINCHLAAGQSHRRQRDRDLVDILEDKASFSELASSSPGAYAPGGSGTLPFDHELILLAGDLNYRVRPLSLVLLPCAQLADPLTLVLAADRRSARRRRLGRRERQQRVAPRARPAPQEPRDEPDVPPALVQGGADPLPADIQVRPAFLPLRFVPRSCSYRPTLLSRRAGMTEGPTSTTRARSAASRHGATASCTAPTVPTR